MPRIRQILQKSLESQLPAKIRTRYLPHNRHKDAPEVVDDQYRKGVWDHLSGRGEFSRFSVVAGFCTLLERPASVLDMGCGTGTLERRLRPLGYKNYLGVDVSATAITTAHADAGDEATFIVGDAETYRSDAHFDVIVFNEMLYYLDEPETVINWWRGQLTEQGFFIISLVEATGGWRVWLRCSDKLTVLDEVLIEQGPHTWRVRVCKPKP